MTDTQYSFSLQIKDKSIQIGGDKAFVETQMDKWLQLFNDELPEALKPAQSSSSPDQTNAAQRTRRPPSMSEFIKTKEPKTIEDILLVTGLYMERFQQKVYFTCSDLMEAVFNGRKSQEEVKAALDQLVEQQYLSTTEPMGLNELGYSLTFTGEQVVKDGFD